MTQDELDALPEDGGITFVEDVIDGKSVLRPMVRAGHALYQGPNDAVMVRDRHGATWMTGWMDGVLYKKLVRS